jgi:hypothetical protein
MPAASLHLWAAASAGGYSRRDTSDGLAELAAGVAAPFRGGAVLGTAASHWVGDIAYTDVEGTLEGWRGPLTARLVAGARSAPQLTGRHLWAHVDLAYAVSSRVAVTLSGGSYPRDPSQNSPGVQFAAGGVRVLIVPTRSQPFRVVVPPAPAVASGATSDAAESAAADAAASAGTVPADAAAGAAPAGRSGTTPGAAGGRGARNPVASIARGALHAVALQVRVAGAEAVEVMGDFTGWQPVPLTRRSADAWAVDLTVPPGLHRFNVRVNHGPWLAPGGVTREEDGFGGVVAVFVAQ